MRNTIIITVLLFIAVIGASIFYFADLNGEKKENLKPLTFLSEETFLITAFQNNITTDNIFRDFEIFEAVLGKEESQRLTFLKTELLRNKSLEPFVTDIEMYLSFQPDKDKIASLITVPVTKKVKPEELNSLLNSLPKNFKTSKQDTLGSSIYRLSYGQKDSSIHLLYYKDIFFASPTKSILVQVLDDKQPKLEKKQINYFVENNSRNTPLSVYFVHDQVGPIAQHMMRSKYGKVISLFDQLGGQSAWNLNFKNDALILSGESETAHKKENYIELFSNQSKTTQELFNYFPETTASYISFSMSNKERFQEDLKQLFKKRKEWEKVNNMHLSVKKEKNLEIPQELTAFFANEFAVVEQSNQTELLFLKVTDANLAKRSLAKLSSNAADSIMRFDQSNILYTWLGDPLKSFPRPYFTQVENVVIMANSQHVLQEYLRDWRRNNLLVGTLGFKNFEKIQGNEANITYFLRTRTSSHLLSQLLKPAFATAYNKKTEYGYQDFFSWSIQIAGNNGKFLSNVYGVFKSKNALGATPEWTYSFDNRPITQPWVFEHSDTSKFILIQEQDHSIHGIHPSGKKMWSTVFAGRVVGDVQQLPDRSLLLVTDKKRLYRFSTAGKPLPGFSIGMPEQPTGSPTLALLDNQQLIFVPAGRQLLVYDMDGNMQDNWKDANIDGRILFEVKVQNNQVFLGTENGHFYQFNHQGKLLKEEIIYDAHFNNPIAIRQNSKGQPTLYALDSTSNLHAVDFLNTASKRRLSKWNSKAMLAFDPYTSNNSLYVLNGKEFAAYNLLDTLPQFNFNFTQDLVDRMQFFKQGNSSSLIGVAARSNNLIYIFDEKGSVLSGFPIEAMPSFYYGKIDYNSGNFLLCIRRDKKLYAFKN